MISDIFYLGKEEWVTVIFGEDGKEINVTPAVNPKQEKSVYDMEDEDFSATKATPFPGRKKSLAKEGVISVGNNTYYYTGDKEGAVGATAGAEDDELEERQEGK